jgi:hypothetical protein
MAGLLLKRNDKGKLSLTVQGCCGDSARWQSEFDRAFTEQVLREGGRIESQSESELVLIDRKGRRHTVAV